MKNSAILALCSLWFAAIPLRSADLPEFRELVDRELFDFEFESLCNGVELDDWAERAKLGLPEGAVVYREVDPEGWAVKLGLKRGDVLLSIDDRKPWHWSQGWTTGSERKLKVRRKDGTEETHTIPSGNSGVTLIYPGRLGIKMVHTHTPETPGYRLVLGAIATAHLNPDVAETALHHAVKAGYQPDAISSNIGVRIALRQNRPGDAWKFASYLLNEAESLEKLPAAYRISVIRAAYANGKLDLLLQANQLWDEGTFVFKEERLEGLKAERDHGWDANHRPSERISDLPAREVSKNRVMIRGVPANAGYPHARNVTQRIQVRRGYGKNSFKRLPHGIGDFIWELDFDCNPTAYQGPEKWRPATRYRVYEVGATREEDVMIARLDMLKEPSDIEIGIGAINTRVDYRTEWGFEAGMKPIRVRIIRLGDEIEIQLDGATVIWMPCRENRDIGFYIANSGMTVEYHRHRIWEILDQNEDEAR